MGDRRQEVVRGSTRSSSPRILPRDLKPRPYGLCRADLATENSIVLRKGNTAICYVQTDSYRSRPSADIGGWQQYYTYDTKERQVMTSTTVITAPSHHTTGPLLWRLKDLPTLTGLSLRTVNRLRATGRLPKPDATFGRAICFKPSTIERWTESGGLCQEAHTTS
jgi:hypothetical protein